MAMNHQFAEKEPTRAEIEETLGPLVLEFGTSWCGYCRAVQPLLAKAFAARPELKHLKIEDGPGRALGRSFQVKLWPTFVFLRDGTEVARLVRPTDARSIADAVMHVASGSSQEER